MESTHEVETLLIVDDEGQILSSLKRLFRPMGYRIFTANGGVEGLDILGREKIHLVISDMRMPEMDGATFLQKVAASWPDTMRILLTGYADLSSTVSAINEGQIYRYASKPWDCDTLVQMVEQALEQKRLETEQARLEQRARKQNEIVGQLNASLEKEVSLRTSELRQAMALLEKAYVSQQKRHVTSMKEFEKIMEGLMRRHKEEKQVLVKALQDARSQVTAGQGEMGHGSI